MSVLTQATCLTKYQNTELMLSYKPVAVLKTQYSEMVALITLSLSHSLSPGPFKGSYDLERGVCDLERLDRPTEAGWDGLPGVR